MKKKTLSLMRLQYFMGRIGTILIAPLVFLLLQICNYRINNLAEVRKQIKAALAAHKGPWIVCANHLTMIDSIFLIYAMHPLRHYITRYRDLPWNLPEKANFYSNLLMGSFCYLSKCIPVNRGGDRTKIKESIGKCMYVLKRNEPLLIFPEGTRSRSGRIDVEKVSYGVGRLATAVNDCRVLCLYLRGNNQDSYSFFPQYGERFTVLVDSMKPDTTLTGLKAHRECAHQIATTLAGLENEYFATHRKRSHRSRRPAREGEEPGLAVY